jgi:UDP-N-acetylglucosamine/UDP-N-acetylgalactosamine 4-epimerase
MPDTYLVTGAAGFIGSNLVERLLADGERVVGLDSFVTGKRENIEPFVADMDFIEGDVRDPATCARACEGADYVLHQAALGSVPRSVDDPATSNEHNVTGTLEMLVAARDAGARRFVYAASSSAYGDTEVLPKHERMCPAPLSPYAVSKYTGELYCKVFWELYGLPTVCLRYFNVFGRRQDPQGMYAAVIPRFARAILRGERPLIFGDGGQSRDFCYVDNAVDANLLACRAGEEAFGESMNIAGGERITIQRLAERMIELLGGETTPEHGPERPGDPRDSLAALDRAAELIGYRPGVDVHAGLERAVEWYRENL